jgi:hypothetical protein
MCGDPATHKVGEVRLWNDPTNYLCCRHFTVVVWDCNGFPYGADEQVPEVDYSAEYREADESDTLPCPDETCGYCGRPPAGPTPEARAEVEKLKAHIAYMEDEKSTQLLITEDYSAALREMARRMARLRRVRQGARDA